MTVICVLSVLGVGSASAQAASVGYTMQIGHMTEGQAIVLSGGQITKFQLDAQPTSCSTGDPENSSDSEWTINLSAPASLSNGSFQFSGQAPSTYYSAAGPAGSDWTGSYTVSGTVSANQRVITGTVTLSDANDPFLKGCSATLSFLAIPTVKDTSGPAGGNTTYQSQFVNFDYRAGVVTDLHAQANFLCGQGEDDVEFRGSDYDLTAIHTTRNGDFSFRTYVLDEYQDILTLTMKGRVDGMRASGRITVSEPPGLTSLTNDICRGSQSWTASRPTPPPPPGPEAFFSWNAVRVPSGTVYRYYFYLSGLSCSDGADEVLVTVEGVHSTLGCHSGGGWASSALEPGRSYTVSAVAEQVVDGRVRKRGVPITEPMQMPGANDLWQPIGRLNGTPPA